MARKKSSGTLAATTLAPPTACDTSGDAVSTLFLESARRGDITTFKDLVENKNRDVNYADERFVYVGLITSEVENFFIIVWNDCFDVGL